MRLLTIGRWEWLWRGLRAGWLLGTGRACGLCLGLGVKPHDCGSALCRVYSRCTWCGESGVAL